MAASVVSRVAGLRLGSFTSFNLVKNAQTAIVNPAFQTRTATTCTAFNNEEEYVVLTRNGTIVCWHPEPQFPYECSLPMPERSAEHTSPLNVQLSKVADQQFIKKPEQFIRAELMKVTHTTKHRWFPHGEKKLAKKTKPDRDYL